MSVMQFIEGYFKHYKAQAGLMPPYITEQYHYRLEVCSDDCVVKGKCKYCGCPPEKKAWVASSCNNEELFPNLMGKQDWEVYKQENNIDIKEIMKSHGV